MHAKEHYVVAGSPTPASTPALSRPRYADDFAAAFLFLIDRLSITS